MFLMLETFRKSGTRNKASAGKMFLNLVGNIFASWEANFVLATLFSRWTNKDTLIDYIMFSSWSETSGFEP